MENEKKAREFWINAGMVEPNNHLADDVATYNPTLKYGKPYIHVREVLPSQDEESDLNMGEFFKSVLTTKLIVFGDMTAFEFAEKTSWDDVWGIVARMYGPAPSPKELSKLLEFKKQAIEHMKKSLMDREFTQRLKDESNLKGFLEKWSEK